MLQVWRSDLTFTPEAMAGWHVVVAEREGSVLGVVAVSLDGLQAEVEHLWVDPPAMGRGLGRLLFEAASGWALAECARRLVIEADPHAEAFYARMGARRVGATPSRPSDRMLPRMVFVLDEA